MSGVGLRGEVGANQDNHCLNCHGSPETQPDSVQNRVYHPTPKTVAPYVYQKPQFLKDSFDYLQPCRVECSAKEHWSKALEHARPEMWSIPFWVRSQFEQTLKKNRDSALPFRVDIQKATIKGELIINGFPFFIDIPYYPEWSNQAEVKTGSYPFVNLNLAISNNALELSQRSLIQFNDIYIGKEDGPGIAPLELWAGNYGGLHLFLEPTSHLGHLANLLSPPMVPVPEARYDFPLFNQHYYEQCSLPEHPDSKCPQPTGPFTYRQPGENYVLDPIGLGLIPHELLDPATGNLPIQFNLEDLTLRLLQTIKRIQAKPKKPSTAIKSEEFKKLDHLNFGSKLNIKLEDIQDFFLAGIIDLAPSRANLDLEYLGENNFSAHLNKFDINLDPMVFPTGPEKEKVFEITGGSFSDTAKITEGFGKEIAGGIYATYSVKTGEIKLQGKLNISLQVAPKASGPLSLTGALAFELTLIEQEGRLIVVPKTNTLRLAGLHVFGKNNTPILSNADLLLTDNPQNKVNKFETFIDPPKFEINFSGDKREKSSKSRHKGREFTPIRLTAETELPLHSEECFINPDIPLHDSHFSGSYNFSDILRTLNLVATLFVSPKLTGIKKFDAFSSTYRTQLKLRPVKFDSRTSPNFGRDLAYQLDIGVKEYSRAFHKKSRHLLKNGVVSYHYRGNSTDLAEHELYLAADKLNYHQGFKPMFILNGVHAYLNLEQVNVTDDTTEFKVPRLDLQLNTRGSNRGLVRGPVKISQVSGKDLSFFINRSKKYLMLGGLDWQFSAQKLHVIPKKQLKLFTPGTKSLGVDGHLQADFNFDFAGDARRWNGAGLVRLKGDSGGDLYLLDRNGNKIENLIRRTRWSFKRIDSINASRGYLLADVGDYRLDLILNLGALLGLPLSERFAGKDAIETLTGLKPYEFFFEMGYDNQPWNKLGFDNRIKDYIHMACLQTPDCAGKLTVRQDGNSSK